MPSAPFDNDGKQVPIITTFLFHAGGHDIPAPLPANANEALAFAWGASGFQRWPKAICRSAIAWGTARIIPENVAELFDGHELLGGTNG